MPSIFNDFVDAMVSGQEPDMELFQALWSALRGVLRSEMQRRGVWQTRPSFLGVVGYTQWSGGGVGQGPLDELTSACFDHVFIRRLAGLGRQARTKDSIDGVVRLAVQQFLLEVQSRHDPLGFRVFEVVSQSLRLAVDARRLVCVSGSPKIRNETCLALDVDVSLDRVREVDVEPLVDLWVDRRLEPLVLASHHELKQLKQDLMADVESFLVDGRPGFRFGNLVGPLKEQVRRSWAARFLNLPGFLNVGSEDEIDPSLGTEELLALRGHVAAVVRCVDQAGSPARKAKVQRYFALLWGYLKGYAFEDVRRWIETRTDDPGVAADDFPEDLPSERQLASLLNIPRARLPELFEQLKARWKDCEERAQTTGKEQTVSQHESGDSPLEGAQGRAWASLQQLQGKRGQPEDATSTDPSWLRPGDLFEVPGTETAGVLWGVVARNPEGSELTCCPVDTVALVDDGDLDLTWSESEAEPYVVRLGLSMQVPVSALGRVRRVGKLSSGGLEAVLEEPSSERPLEEREQEWMPSYSEWMEDGPLAARDALKTHLAAQAYGRPVADDGGSSLPKRSRKSPWPLLATAAGLLLMVSGTAVHFRGQAVDLGGQVAELGERVEALRSEVEYWKRPGIQVGESVLNLGEDVRGEIFIEVAEDDRFYLVRLVREFVDGYRFVRVEGVTANNETLFATESVPQATEYKLLLPVDLLEHGSLELRLVGLQGDRATILDEGTVHKLDIEPRP